MKKTLMLALAATLALGSFAADKSKTKSKKAKKACKTEQCCQKPCDETKCTPKPGCCKM